MDNKQTDEKMNTLLKDYIKKFPPFIQRLIMAFCAFLGIIIAKFSGILNKENLEKIISIIQIIFINHTIVIIFAVIIVAICVTICICAKFENEKEITKYNSESFKEVLDKRDFDEFIIKKSKDGSTTYSIIKNDKNIKHHQYNKVVPFRNNKTEVK